MWVIRCVVMHQNVVNYVKGFLSLGSSSTPLSASSKMTMHACSIFHFFFVNCRRQRWCWSCWKWSEVVDDGLCGCWLMSCCVWLHHHSPCHHQTRMRHPHTEKHTRHRRHHSILHTSLLTQLQMNVCIVVMNRCCLQMMTMMIDDERMKTLFWRQRLLRTMCLTLTCCLHRTQLTSKQHDMHDQLQ